MRGALVLLLMGLAMSLAAVELGTARVNVLQQLGPPVSALKRGDTEVLSYRDGVRLTLKGGRVVGIIGLNAGETAAAPPVPVEPEVPAEPAQPAPQPEPEQEEQAAAESDARARAEMEKAIMDLENMAAREAEPRGFEVVAFLVELAVKGIMTLAALKLACKYWNSDVPWSGLLLVSVMDVITRGLVGYIGYAALDMMSLFYADEAVAALVMVGVLRKVSINQRLALAIEVVVTTKVFSIVVGSLVVTVLMRSVF